LFECQRRRIRIPEDFGISGFNDFDIASTVHPTLTSVKTYRYEMGRKSIEMLIAAISGNRPAERVVNLGYQLIERESTSR
jgi:LacI family gluconate utilization system Gnt-I transcriptional repressor